MKLTTTLFLFIAGALSLSAQTIINSQGDWDTFAGAGAASITTDATINEGISITATSLNVTGGATLTNFGTLNVMPNGSYVDGTSTFINVGTYVCAAGGNHQGLTINTGSYTAGGGFAGGGTFEFCGTFSIPGPIFPPANSGSAPVGTPCDDGDSMTEDDIIRDAICSCAGFVPIPTLSQWGIMLLGLVVVIFGAVAIVQRKEKVIVS